MSAVTILVDLSTGEATEFADHRAAALECMARNRGRNPLRPDRPVGQQGPLRFMTYPASGVDVLDLVNQRRAASDLAPLDRLDMRALPLRPPLYLREFPDFDADGATKIESLLATGGWEDTSWHNDSSPSVTCDVFQLFVDFADPEQRRIEPMGSKRFLMQDEGADVLETDDWADVLAFINEGKRDFTPCSAATLIDLGDFLAIQARIERGEKITFEELVICHAPLTDEYSAYLTAHDIPGGSADELDLEPLSAEERAWIADFITRWERVEEAFR